MATVATQPSVKVIGANGQISLGKQFAGRQVLVEEREPGVWPHLSIMTSGPGSSARTLVFRLSCARCPAHLAIDLLPAAFADFAQSQSSITPGSFQVTATKIDTNA